MRSIKKLTSVLAISSLALSYPAAAFHGYGDYVTPAAPTSWSGSLNVIKGFVNIDCAITLTLNGPNESGDGVAVSHTDEAHLTASVVFSSPNEHCPNITVNPISSVDLDPVNNEITLNGVFVNTVLVPGNCAGTLKADFDPVTKELSVNTVALPPVTDTNTCYVDGVLELVSPSSVSIGSH